MEVEGCLSEHVLRRAASSSSLGKNVTQYLGEVPLVREGAFIFGA